MTWTTRQRSERGSLAAISAGTGPGPGVLLIHGVGLRAEAWGGQIETLATKARVTAVDLPGHGDSPALPGRPGLADYVAAVRTAWTGPTVIVGHSMGAMIALELAAQYPADTLGVVALNAIFRREPSARDAVQARAASLDGLTPGDPGPTLTRWFGTSASPERAACDRWLRAVSPAGYRAAYQVFAMSDGPADGALGALRCPALFMTGEDEPNSTPEMSQRMAQLVPNGEAVVLPGAAHMMPMTHTDLVNDYLARFVARVTDDADHLPPSKGMP